MKFKLYERRIVNNAKSFIAPKASVKTIDAKKSAIKNKFLKIKAANMDLFDEDDELLNTVFGFWRNGFTFDIFQTDGVLIDVTSTTRSISAEENQQILRYFYELGWFKFEITFYNDYNMELFKAEGEMSMDFDDPNCYNGSNIYDRTMSLNYIFYAVDNPDFTPYNYSKTVKCPMNSLKEGEDLLCDIVKQAFLGGSESFK